MVAGFFGAALAANPERVAVAFEPDSAMMVGSKDTFRTPTFDDVRVGVAVAIVGSGLDHRKAGLGRVHETG